MASALGHVSCRIETSFAPCFSLSPRVQRDKSPVSCSPPPLISKLHELLADPFRSAFRVDPSSSLRLQVPVSPYAIIPDPLNLFPPTSGMRRLSTFSQAISLSRSPPPPQSFSSFSHANGWTLFYASGCLNKFFPPTHPPHPLVDLRKTPLAPSSPQAATNVPCPPCNSESLELKETLRDYCSCFPPWLPFPTRL